MRPGRRARPTAAAALVLAAAVALWTAAVGAAEPEWVELKDCRLVKHPANDGDSFHVRHGEEQYIFRLYFVDAPETDDAFPDRVADQAAYWGIAPVDVPRHGAAAAAYVRRALARPFTVYTRWADARGQSSQPRYFAFVRTGGGYLHENLVGKGLARKYGREAVRPDGMGTRESWARLDKLQRQARERRVGAWAEAAPAGGGEFASYPMACPRQLPVYSLREPGRQAGFLKEGTEVVVMAPPSNGLVRIRFAAGRGAPNYEALGRAEDLGLDEGGAPLPAATPAPRRSRR